MAEPLSTVTGRYEIRCHLITSLEKKQLYGSVDFLIVIQALEGFCRRFRSRKYRKTHGLPERDY